MRCLDEALMGYIDQNSIIFVRKVTGAANVTLKFLSWYGSGSQVQGFGFSVQNLLPRAMDWLVSAPAHFARHWVLGFRVQGLRFRV